MFPEACPLRNRGARVTASEAPVPAVKVKPSPTVEDREVRHLHRLSEQLGAPTRRSDSEGRHLVQRPFNDLENRHDSVEILTHVTRGQRGRVERRVLLRSALPTHPVEGAQRGSERRIWLGADSLGDREAPTAHRRAEAVVLQQRCEGLACRVVRQCVGAFGVRCRGESGRCGVLAGLRQEEIGVLAARRNSLPLACADHRLDLCAALVPPHDARRSPVSGISTSGRLRTVVRNASLADGVCHAWGRTVGCSPGARVSAGPDRRCRRARRGRQCPVGHREQAGQRDGKGGPSATSHQPDVPESPVREESGLDEPSDLVRRGLDGSASDPAVRAAASAPPRHPASARRSAGGRG